MSTPALIAEDVRKRFGNSVQALDGLSMAVPEGMVYGLLGPNGAGKTTFVRVLATLLRHDSGRAEVLGIDVLDNPFAVRNRIGLAGQFAAIDEVLTGRENLEMVGRLYHLGRTESARRAAEVLERFDLVDAADRRAATYSGGMRRRLDLAATLVGQPEIVFLDEPTTGLDPRSRSALWDMVEELRAQGITILLTTQYLEEADRLADRIAVIDNGAIVAEGTADELKAGVGGNRLVVRVADGAQAQAAADALRTLCQSGEPEIEGARVGLGIDAPEVTAEAVRRLDAGSIGLAGLEVRQPTLDDVFLALTGHHAEPVDEPPVDGGPGDAAQDGHAPLEVQR